MTSVISDLVLILSDSVALTILAKATVILLLGLVAGALSVRAQASWRHLVFATTFAALLALPMVVMIMPDLPVEVTASAPVAESATAAAARVASLTAIEPAVTITTAKPAAIAETSAMPSTTTLLLVAWIAGGLFLSLSLVVDLMRVRHFRRHGLPSERLRGLVERLTIEARLKPVDVLLHEKLQAPVTFGFFNPTVMLPADAENWNEADLNRALVHELEHIRRGDWATQMAARIACAFYWFHPLVWMAWRKLSFEAERACDDAVVRTAGNADYAQQLVSLSRQLSTARTQPMLGMAKRSDLARRVSSLLDGTRSRGRAGLAAAAFSMLVGLFVLIPIGSLRAVAQVQPQPEVAQDRNPQPAVKATPPQKAVKPEDDDDDGDGDGDGDGDDIGGRNRLDIALFKAAQRNSAETARMLLDEGANVNAELSGDGTPLIAAARGGSVDMIRLLLDRGAKPNLGIGGDGNPLLNAARKGHLQAVILLLERGADINAGVEGDGNALIMAAGSGHSEIVKLLLDRGADIHKVVAGDENAIIKACEQGRLEMVKLLVSRGADVNSSVRVQEGREDKLVEEYRTPLSMARRGGHGAIVEYLLSVGARQ